MHANPAIPQESKIFQHGAQLRGQRRADTASHPHRQTGPPHASAHFPVSQPPRYSQVSHEEAFVAPAIRHAPQQSSVQTSHVATRSLPQRAARPASGAAYQQNQIPEIVEPGHPAAHTSRTHDKGDPFVQHVEPAPVVEPSTLPDGDYELNMLFKMKFDELKDESFDKDPRAGDPVLPKEQLDKPLVERLQFAQYNLDPVGQAEFFSALPTTEWEDAGDWFLDQFSEIIQKTKQARQNKRKLAQVLEKDIEQRHEHVAKKQQLVQSAMEKMKEQGEGLVPKSPRASKSPRPRRG